MNSKEEKKQDLLIARKLSRLKRKVFKGDLLTLQLKEICGTEYTYDEFEIYPSRKWLAVFYHKSRKTLVTTIVHSIVGKGVSGISVLKNYTK